MRTTLTLDDDVAHQLAELAHSTRKPFKQVLNDTLRRGLGTGTPKRKQFVLKPFHAAFAPGVDQRRLSQLYDEMEVETYVEKARKPR